MHIAPNVVRLPIFHTTDQCGVVYAAARRFGRIVHFDLNRGIARLEKERP